MDQTRPNGQQTHEEASALFWRLYGEKYAAVLRIGEELARENEMRMEQCETAAMADGGE